MYIGEFDGEHSGIGQYIDDNNNIKYNGIFIEGNYFDGISKCYHPQYDDIVYEGSIINNKFNGNGIHYIYDSPGEINEIFEGFFENGKIKRGKHICKDNNFINMEFEGNFYENSCEGICIKYHNEICGNKNFSITVKNYEYDREIYIGRFENFYILNGEGEIRNRHNTIIYKGIFYNGLWFDGNNKYYNPSTNDIIFEGNIINGRINGYGKYYGYNGCNHSGLYKYIEGYFLEGEINYNHITSYSGNFSYIAENELCSNPEFNNFNVEYFDCNIVNSEIINGKKIITINKKKNKKFTIIYENKISKLTEYVNGDGFTYTGIFNSCTGIHNSDIYKLSTKINGEGSIINDSGIIKFTGKIFYGLCFNGKNKLFNLENLIIYESNTTELFGNKFKIYKEGLLSIYCYNIINDECHCNIYKNGVFCKNIVYDYNSNGDIYHELIKKYK